MTVSLKVGICYLIAEFLADALVFFRLFEAARTVSAALLKSLLYGCNDFLVLV